MEATRARRIETEVSQLPVAEQQGLGERVQERLRSRQEASVDERLLEAMALDPEIQAENRAIAREFAVTEADGLDRVG